MCSVASQYHNSRLQNSYKIALRNILGYTSSAMSCGVNCLCNIFVIIKLYMLYTFIKPKIPELFIVFLLFIITFALALYALLTILYCTITGVESQRFISWFLAHGIIQNRLHIYGISGIEFSKLPIVMTKFIQNDTDDYDHQGIIRFFFLFISSVLVKSTVNWSNYNYFLRIFIVIMLL